MQTMTRSPTKPKSASACSSSRTRPGGSTRISTRPSTSPRSDSNRARPLATKRGTSAAGHATWLGSRLGARAPPHPPTHGARSANALRTAHLRFDVRDLLGDRRPIGIERARLHVDAMGFGQSTDANVSISQVLEDERVALVGQLHGALQLGGSGGVVAL